MGIRLSENVFIFLLPLRISKLDRGMVYPQNNGTELGLTGEPEANMVPSL